MLCKDITAPCVWTAGQGNYVRLWGLRGGVIQKGAASALQGPTDDDYACWGVRSGWAAFPCNKCFQGHAERPWQHYRAIQPRGHLRSYDGWRRISIHFTSRLSWRDCRGQCSKDGRLRPAFPGAYLRNKSAFVPYCCFQAAGLFPAVPYVRLGVPRGGGRALPGCRSNPKLAASLGEENCPVWASASRIVLSAEGSGRAHPSGDHAIRPIQFVSPRSVRFTSASRWRWPKDRLRPQGDGASCWRLIQLPPCRSLCSRL